jgi:hypothetical protein
MAPTQMKNRARLYLVTVFKFSSCARKQNTHPPMPRRISFTGRGPEMRHKVLRKPQLVDTVYLSNLYSKSQLILPRDLPLPRSRRLVPDIPERRWSLGVTRTGRNRPLVTMKFLRRVIGTLKEPNSFRSDDIYKTDIGTNERRFPHVLPAHKPR